MDQQKIQLRKIRDFGENFNDTFQFIRQELKPLFSCFTVIGLGFVLLDSMLVLLYKSQIQDAVGNINSRDVISYTDIFSIYNGTFFLILALGVISFAAMCTTVAVYMKYYDHYGVSPSVGELWSSFLKYFLRTAVLGIIHVVLFFAGLFFCFLPGFYFLFVLMPYAFIVVNEDLGIGQAFNRCFELIKENFWVTAAIYIVLGLLAFVMSLFVAFVTELVSGAGSIFSMDNIRESNPVADIILNVLQYYFYIIIYVSVGLHYYNLVERKEGAGLAKRLEGLGSNINPNENIEEQY